MYLWTYLYEERRLYSSITLILEQTPIYNYVFTIWLNESSLQPHKEILF